MKERLVPALLVIAAVCASGPAFASSDHFSFGVIGHIFSKTSDESVWRKTIEETDAANLAFVVANGIKAKEEPCADQLYYRRKALFEDAGHGLIVSLAASDWVDCRRNNGRTAAIERLNRIRDLFFVGEFSFGRTKIPLVRQSLRPKFRSYGENIRWTVGGIMFATMNLPATNNHYLSAAGRNSEFEDRLVANRSWMQQLFNAAALKNMKAIVIFCDGNPFLKLESSSLFGLSRRRDGFSEMRNQILSLGAKFPGKVLVIHSQGMAERTTPKRIQWRSNIGHVDAGSGWTRFDVNPFLSTLFAAAEFPEPQANPKP
jgi:hypothetical protein